MEAGGGVALSVIAEGAAEASRFDALSSIVGEIEVQYAPDGTTGSVSGLNVLVDGAKSNWILVVKNGERVPAELAAEIGKNVGSESKAWGFRFAVRDLYCGRPLQLTHAEAGEVRLFHRRRARMQPDGRMKVQGTVVRLRSSIDRVLYESPMSHAEDLRSKGGVEVGLVVRLFRWTGAILRGLPRSLARPARTYLWVEAGWRPDR